MSSTRSWTVQAGVAAALLVAGAGVGAAQTLVENSAEARFQLDVKVPDAALASYLPPGWTPNVAAQGPAKDCNLRVIFIDRNNREAAIASLESAKERLREGMSVWIAPEGTPPCGMEIVVGARPARSHSV